MSHTKATKDEVIELETSYWDAMKAKDGVRSAALSGETTLVTGAQGVALIPKAKMGQMTESGEWTLESYELAEIHVETPTPDVAIIVYTVTQKVNINGKAQELRAADSSTWVRGSEGWQCYAHSETFLSDATA
ncbi:MAG: nuclear transport factor 2 family protein [Devosia sp.]